MEQALLDHISTNGELQNSQEFAKQNNYDHTELVGVIKSLASENFVIDTPVAVTVLTSEGQNYLEKGTPEGQVYAYVKEKGEVAQGALMKDLGAVGKIGFGHAMKAGWVALDKATKMVTASAESINDEIQRMLAEVNAPGSIEEVKVNTDMLKKRKLIAAGGKDSSYFQVAKGPAFAPSRQKLESDLTVDLLKDDAWKTKTFKPYNWNALGKPEKQGALHPLLKVRSQFRRILIEMGFEEMPTNNFVSNSFWNFDSLFQPQQHPARDAHDTFFVKSPEKTVDWPDDYLERVKEMHEHGGSESIGWRYDWDIEEAKKNILRTHTTAVSSRMLYQLAQNPEGFKPKKYFSIDRVFRNENVDATHLAEFHQVEGLVADYNLSLGDLIGTITEFFKKIGITNLRFKPAYNPYTEPSMEIFGYHPLLKKWTEIGNSGIFRPEMLLPMGLPPDVRVIAWGLSLERPTMIQYGVKNIRDLFGHKVTLQHIVDNPICRFN